MMSKNYVIGVDFGTDSVRAVIIDSENGSEVSSHVSFYRRWGEGKYCDSAGNSFRQHPLDYIEGLLESVRGALAKGPAGVSDEVRAISVDTTGSTPVAVDKNGTPLALIDDFKENPDAMFILWKDHTAIEEAERINEVSKNWGGIDYTKYEGGVYSSEWFWSKIVHIMETDAKVREKAFSWVEHCDWIPAILTGTTNPLNIKRSRCAAGHKAMWHEDFDGLPPENYLVAISPVLKGLRERLYSITFTSDTVVGYLNDEWAEKFGLRGRVSVGVGAFDAHMGAVGGEIEPYMLSKIIGTSTCDILVAPMEEMKVKLIRGICGQVNGSVVPGMLGMEAGQSAFGDVYAWFRNLLLWPYEAILSQNNALADQKKLKTILSDLSYKIIPALSGEAASMAVGESGITALDWLNGRRTPDANQALRGAIMGLNLGSSAPAIFKSLVEATAFGSKKIVDRFIEEGVPIRGVIALGGVAKKSPFVLQVLSDVLNMPIKVARSEQAVALGAAMFAATSAGIYKRVEDAQNKMGNGFEKEYRPIGSNVKKYAELYEKYSELARFAEKSIVK
jgi:L-ribulokinase